jgi:spermidine/putrescine transport system permease protein
VSSTTGPRGATRRILGLNAWLVYLFLYSPIILLVVFSFNDNRNVGVWTGASLRWYREMFDNAPVLNAIRISIIVAVVSTIIATVLGTMAALALERFKFWSRRTYDAVLYLPIIIPDVTMAVMMLLFFSLSFQILDGLFGIEFGRGLATIILSHVAFNISFVAVVVRARIARMDPALEEAAADLYAGRWQAFRHVTLPLIMPGIAGGALLALTLSLDDVVITSFVSGPGSTPLSVYVFGLIRRGVTPLINAVSTFMLAGSMLLVVASLALQRRSRGEVAPTLTGE